MKKVLWLFPTLIIFFATPANAALVQCVINSPGGSLCSLCQFLGTIKAVLDFIMGMAFLGAIILIAKSGLDMYFTAGNVGQVKNAMQNILKVVVGLIIMIAAWAVINTIIIFLASPGSPPYFWNNIDC